MSAADLAHWIASLDFFTAIRESVIVFPAVLATHLASIAFFGGMILLTDLRLLGFALRDCPISDVIKQLRPWKWAGFVVMVTCGILLAGSKFDMYYNNPYFQTKMILLALVGVHALVFRRSVYSEAANLDRTKEIPRTAKVAACISLALWLGILTAGRWIGYYEPPQFRKTVDSALDRSVALSARSGLTSPGRSNP